MPLVIFNNLKDKDKSDAIKKLISASTPSQDYYFMIILAISMAAFGLLINNITIVIGSMLVAPMLYPILSLSLGIVMADPKLISRSLVTILYSLLIAVTISVLISLFFSPSSFNVTLLNYYNLEHSLAYAIVAIISGLAGSFAVTKPHLNESLPGTAISVTLIPPLAAIGIGIANFNWPIINSAFVIFLINVTGIVFSSMLVFSLMNLYVKRNLAEKQIEDEEKKLEEEEKLAEENND